MITADYYLYKYLCTCTCARCYYDFMKEMKHRTMCHGLTIDILTQSASVNHRPQHKQNRLKDTKTGDCQLGHLKLDPFHKSLTPKFICKNLFIIYHLTLKLTRTVIMILAIRFVWSRGQGLGFMYIKRAMIITGVLPRAIFLYIQNYICTGRYFLHFQAIICLSPIF